VCRDCCCGTVEKHPDTDHDAQLRELRVALKHCADVTVSTCLDACDQSNVVVVGPSVRGRRSGGRPAWLSGVLEPATVRAVADWVRGGGPGMAPCPDALDEHRFRAPSSRRGRQEV
jgi:hypothetical protein